MKTTGYLIREIQPDDNPSMALVIRKTLEEFGANKPGTVYFDPTTDDLYQLFRADRSVYFVAEKDGVVAGGSGIFPTEGLPDGCCELVKLYVGKEARGTGLGKALMQQCFIAAKEKGFTTIYLETMPELSIAVGLYEKMGFKYLPGPLGNSGHFGCSIWMLKQL